MQCERGRTIALDVRVGIRGKECAMICCRLHGIGGEEGRARRGLFKVFDVGGRILRFR